MYLQGQDWAKGQMSSKEQPKLVLITKVRIQGGLFVIWFEQLPLLLLLLSLGESGFLLPLVLLFVLSKSGGSACVGLHNWEIRNQKTVEKCNFCLLLENGILEANSGVESIQHKEKALSSSVFDRFSLEKSLGRLIIWGHRYVCVLFQGYNTIVIALCTMTYIS